MQGDGAGGINGTRTISVGESTNTGVIQDINGDSIADIIASGFTRNSGMLMSVLIGDGAGNLGEPFYYGTGSAPRFLVTGDFNIDGKSDVVTANYTSSDVKALMTIPCTRQTPTPTPLPTPRQLRERTTRI